MSVTEELRAMENTVAMRKESAALVDAYSDAVYKLCRSLTYSKEDADDLFQETFIKAVEQPHKVFMSENPRGFLLATTLYIWKSWKRRYARRKRLAPTEELTEFEESNEDVEAEVWRQEESHIVRGLVKSLPDKFRIPIILYYTLDYSVPDIAITMQIPTGTVKSRLYKARKLVKKGLEAIEYAQ